MTVPVVDIFAGPGGLGEGFSAFDGKESDRFRIALSIEKDKVAYQTLRLRALKRSLEGKEHREYERHIRGEIDWSTLRQRLPFKVAGAEAEAHLLELGRRSTDRVRELIRKCIPENTPWVLVGGPPCQAYSLAGRARNRGIRGYQPDKDKRQTLYIEYLQILADHAPPVFVMENVKGLLSAKLHQDMLFDRILSDLQLPAKALKREQRRGNQNPEYTIHAFSPAEADSGFLVRSEDFGIPQRRHRVLLLGIRNDVKAASIGKLTKRSGATVKDTLEDLTPLRSGLSKGDSASAWLQTVKRFRGQQWVKSLDADVRREIRRAIESVSVPPAGRGDNHLHGNRNPILNHSARGHIAADLERYLFASSFAQVRGHSPTLREFPEVLLPKHKNVQHALKHGNFADRFRVQVADMQATTITSHISKDGHYYIHYDPGQCRSLTVREAARLQTFPDDYFFCGPRTAQYHQVGNAVPPKLATQIAAVVAGVLDS